METAVAIKEDRNLVKIEDYAMSVTSLLGQVALIQNVMKEVMQENVHYGKIPGTDKPTLLKPGAEKLCLTFRLNPSYEIIEKIREKDFIAYTVKCSLTHIISQTPIASGIGSCNSRETKYRYRMIQSEKKPNKEEAAILKAKGLGRWKKFGEAWSWMERIENDNPWDHDNTLIKMACKRALVAATLNATVASDIFTQDIEDMPPEMVVNGESIPEKKVETETPQPVESNLNVLVPMTDKQRNKLWAMMKGEKELTDTEVRNFMAWYQAKTGVEVVQVDGKPRLSTSSASKFIEHFEEEFTEFTKA